MSTPAHQGPAGPARRRWLVGTVVLVLVAAVLALAIGLRGGNDPAAAEDTTGTASPSTAPSTASSTDAATDGSTGPAATGTEAPNTGPAVGPTEGGDAAPPALPAVALDAPAPVGNGVVATLPAIEAIEGEAKGPGNVNGPALRVTVRIENGTDQPIPLDGVATNLYHGADATPAAPLDDASEQPFTGTLAAGEQAQAVYVFTVPADDRSSVTVEVGYEAGAPLLLFTGPVG
jgi:hypothetical protein